MRYNDQIKAHVGKMADDLHPLRVQALFQRIPDEDCEVLDLAGRPEDLVVDHLAVPPVAIRPSVEMDGASNEDDITMKLMVGGGGGGCCGVCGGGGGGVCGGVCGDGSVCGGGGDCGGGGCGDVMMVLLPASWLWA